MIINITNGEEFNNYISSKEEGLFIPFNEALIDGINLYPLFSLEFIFERCKSLKVSKDLYLSKLDVFLNVLKKINSNDILILWFGKDTFCQINLLGVLTYLESLNISNKIFLNIIDDETKEILEKETEIKLGSFTNTYKRLFIDNKFIKCELDYINIAIKEYFYLKDKNNDIYKFIESNSSKLNKENLFKQVFLMTRKYGLGDSQIYNLIDNIMRS